MAGLDTGREVTPETQASYSNGQRFGRRARVLVVLVSMLGGLLVAEVAIRVLDLAPGLRRISLSDPDSVYQKSDNPRLGFEMKPNYRAENPDSYLNYPRTNAHGQRDVEREIAKPSGGRRAVLLGDSVVEGFGLREIDETISQRMEKRLAARDWEVLNFGVSGYCTLAEVEMLKTKALPFRPDVVVLVFVQNDFENYNQDNAGVAQGEPPGWLVRTLLDYSHLFRYAYARLGSGTGADAISNNNVVEGLQEFAQLAEQHGFRPVIAVWPQFTNNEVMDLHPMPGGSKDLIVERLAQMHGISAVRISDVFRRHMLESTDGTVANPRVHYTVEGDGMHPTVEAADIVANTLSRVVENAPPFQRSKNEIDVEAIVAAESVSQDNPENAQRYANQANVYARNGQLDMAAAYYRIALDVDAKSADVQTNYGKILAQLDRRSEAREHLENAVALSPRHAYARTNLGVLLLGEGEYGDAAKHFRVAITVEPNRADSRYQLGLALLRSEPASGENVREAAEQYRKAIAIRPDFVAARFELATLLERQGELASAVGNYRHVVEVSPEHVNALNNLAWILATAKDAGLRNGAEAVQFAETAVDLTERQQPSILDTLAAAYAEVGRFDDAVRTVEAAIQLSPDKGTSLAKGLRERRELYQAEMPYRQSEGESQGG